MRNFAEFKRRLKEEAVFEVERFLHNPGKCLLRVVRVRTQDVSTVRVDALGQLISEKSSYLPFGEVADWEFAENSAIRWETDSSGNRVKGCCCRFLSAGERKAIDSATAEQEAGKA